MSYPCHRHHLPIRLRESSRWLRTGTISSSKVYSKSRDPRGTSASSYTTTYNTISSCATKLNYALTLQLTGGSTVSILLKPKKLVSVMQHACHAAARLSCMCINIKSLVCGKSENFHFTAAPFVITRPRQIWRQSETCVLAAVNQNYDNYYYY